MRRGCFFLILIMSLGTFIYLAPLYFKGSLLDPNAGVLNWGLVATIFVSLTILGFFFEFERAAAGAKEIALVSMLGTISALSRLPFAAMMNFQPCTFFIICSGYVFGPVAGFMVACLTALISNLFLGHGPWTPYQMFIWGLVGITAAWLRKLPLSKSTAVVALAAFGFLWGWLYGIIINVWFWTYFVYPLTLKTYLLTLLNAVIWDATHALANVFFVGIFGARVIATMERFKKRFYWSIERDGVK
ncbi:MAG: ECF transporter S component [Deltaproteobacteria bacterium]|nr:MAG: ECF transporter S component [Deltaproteobacteria bacterium]